MEIFKAGLAKTLLIFIFGFFFIFLSCNEAPSDFDLASSSNGDAKVLSSSVASISKIGPMDSTVVDHIQEPGEGVTRLVVKSIRSSTSPVYNVFDIGYNGKLEIKGNGYYKFTKDENSNIWRLEINGETNQVFSIHVGAKVSRFASASQVFLALGIVLIIIGIICLIFTFGVFGYTIVGAGILVAFIGYLLGKI